MSMTKKALIAGAFLTAASIAGTATAGAPVVYGKAFLSFHSNSFEDSASDELELRSNASRLGVKGKHKLTDELTGFYKLEYQTNFDGAGTVFSYRNIYAGIKGGFGAIQVGRFDTPVKKAQGKIDLFNDLYLGDIGNLTDRTYDADDRSSNTIQYTTPKFGGGFTGKLALTAGEVSEQDADEAGNDDGVLDPNEAANVRDGLDGVQASLTYQAGDLYAAVAFGSDHEANDEDVVRAAVQYAITDATKLGLLVQTAEDDANDLEDTSLIFSASHKMGKNTFKFQYGTNDRDVASTGALSEERRLLNIGVDHKLNKKAKLFAYYGNLETDTGTTADTSTLAVGTEIKF